MVIQALRPRPVGESGRAAARGRRGRSGRRPLERATPRASRGASRTGAAALKKAKTAGAVGGRSQAARSELNKGSPPTPRPAPGVQVAAISRRPAPRAYYNRARRQRAKAQRLPVAQRVTPNRSQATRLSDNDVIQLGRREDGVSSVNWTRRVRRSNSSHSGLTAASTTSGHAPGLTAHSSS